MELAEEIKLLKNTIHAYDTILIGAGSGLSTAAGFTYDGERFYENFKDFEQAYRFHDMYQGGFYPFASIEEYWAYWSRFIDINRYQNPPYPVYKQLYEIIKNKDYFVLTTNVDHCFQKANFAKERLFYTQGDYGLFQCCEPCAQVTYDNEEIIHKMVKTQNHMRISKSLIPYCPCCGKPMTMNLRCDERFVEDKGWHAAAKRYQKFIEHHQHSRILYLEIGVGFNTPGIIKYPFWKMCIQNINAAYVNINTKEASCPHEIEERSICIHDDIRKVLQQLSKKEKDV